MIAWHERRLLPVSDRLVGDPRTRFVLGDFFALSAAGALPGQPYDAVLLDIDHTPRHVLDPSHAPFYTADGLRRLADQLVPGGVFALWSDDPPDEELLATARQVFDDCEAHVVEFSNPLTRGTSSNTVYVMRSSRRPTAG